MNVRNITKYIFFATAIGLMFMAWFAEARNFPNDAVTWTGAIPTWDSAAITYATNTKTILNVNITWPATEGTYGTLLNDLNCGEQETIYGFTQERGTQSIDLNYVCDDYLVFLSNENTDAYARVTYVNYALPSTTTTTMNMTNPTQDIFSGWILFFIMFFGMFVLWNKFRRKGGD